MQDGIIEYIVKLWNKLGYRLFLLTGFIGILLIYISDRSAVEKTVLSEYSPEEYRLHLEKTLTDILSQVEGAGKVSLMITLESGEEKIYAVQEKTDRNEQSVSAQRSTQTNSRTSYENEYVMLGGSAGNEALIEKTLQPAVQGVVVVCQGAEDVKVVSNITNAVSVVLDIPTNRVCVIKMQ